MESTVKVLAVADPAMLVYADPASGVLEEYTRATGCKVQFDIVPWAQFAPAMKDAFAGRADYDVVTVCGHMWMFDQVAAGNLDPADYSPSDYDEADILPAVRRELTCNGVPYLYPSFCDGHILLYRKSVVGELPRQMSTEDLPDLVEQLRCPQGMAPLVLKAHPSEIFLDALPYLREGGGNVVDTKTMRPDLTGAGTVAGLERYLRLAGQCPPGCGSFGNEEVRDWFAAGKTAMAVTWSGQLGVVLDDNCKESQDVGYATFTKPFNVTWSFGVSAGSPRKETAHHLCRYLTSKRWDAVAGRRSGAPVRTSSYREGKDVAYYGLVEEMISRYSAPLAGFAGSGDAYGVVYEEIHAAFRGEKTAREALAEASRRMEPFLKV